MEDRKFSINIENLIIGVTIGFFLGYLAAKKIIEPTLGNQSMSQLNIGIQNLNDRLARLGILADIPAPSLTPSFSDQKKQQINKMNLEEENDEDFTIKKDDKGRMCGANFHRRLYSAKE